jgi:hypothetical protein
MTENTDVLTARNNNGEQAYSNALWYSGSFSLWSAGWPPTDQYFSLSLPLGVTVNLEAFMCSDVATSADGSTCTTLAGGRRLASRLPQCTHFYRQIQFATGLVLVAQPPTERNPNWTVTNTKKVCGNTFQEVQLPVSEAVYTTDISTMPWPGAPPAWCGVWGTLTEERPNATAVTLRSEDDPFIVAGQVTDCSYEFGLNKRVYAHWGLVYLVLPGCCAVVLSLLTLLCLVARRRATLRSVATRATTPRDEGTPLSAPSQFAAPSAYGATTGTGAVSKGFQRLTTKH